MTDTAAAILILPTMIALVIVLEGSRLCCGHVARKWRSRQRVGGGSGAVESARMSAGS